MAVDISPFTKYFDDEKVETLIDDQTSKIFIGHARQNNPSTSSPVWLIGRALVTGGEVTQFSWADSRQFNQIWDDRDSLFGTAPFSNNVSILCDGVDDYISIGNVSELDFDIANPFTISAWVRANATTGAERIIFSKQAGSNNPGYRFASQSPGLRFHLSGGTAGNRLELRGTTASNPTDQFWHHCVATYDGSGNDTGVNIYFDGSVVSTTSNGSATVTGSTTNAIAAQYSGRNGTTAEWDGFMDEIAVFDVELSAAQVTELYNSGTPGNIIGATYENDNVGWWRHDGDTFPTIIDQGPASSNNATMTNMVASALVGEVP